MGLKLYQTTLELANARAKLEKERRLSEQTLEEFKAALLRETRRRKLADARALLATAPIRDLIKDGLLTVGNEIRHAQVRALVAEAVPKLLEEVVPRIAEAIREHLKDITPTVLDEDCCDADSPPHYSPLDFELLIKAQTELANAEVALERERKLHENNIQDLKEAAPTLVDAIVAALDVTHRENVDAIVAALDAPPRPPVGSKRPRDV